MFHKQRTKRKLITLFLFFGYLTVNGSIGMEGEEQRKINKKNGPKWHRNQNENQQVIGWIGVVYTLN